MKVFIKGYFFKNLGDDLFVRTLVSRYPLHRFTLATRKEFATAFEDVRNLNVINLHVIRRGINKILNRINTSKNLVDRIERRSDITVLIGGSLFQQWTDDEKERKNVAKMARGINATYILGANFGPYYSQAYYDNAKKAFAQTKDICFRDRYSYDLFDDLTNVRYAPDILFGMEYPTIQENTDQKKRCAISVIDCSTRKSLRPYTDSYTNFVKKAIDFYCGEDYEVSLISFCEAEGDEKAISQVLCACGNEVRNQVKVVKYNGTNSQQILQEIGKATCVIATRFHSMIFALAYRVPVIPVIYNEKSFRVLEDLGCEQYGVLPEQLDRYDFTSARYVVVDDPEKLKEKANAQFAALDELLEKET